VSDSRTTRVERRNRKAELANWTGCTCLLTGGTVAPRKPRLLLRFVGRFDFLLPLVLCANTAVAARSVRTPGALENWANCRLYTATSIMLVVRHASKTGVLGSGKKNSRKHVHNSDIHHTCTKECK
jgi:hypothetical protein